MTKVLRKRIRKLARDVSRLEGKLSQARFGDIEEILKDIAMLEARRVAGARKHTSLPTYILADYGFNIVDREAHLIEKKERRKKMAKKKKAAKKKAKKTVRKKK